MMRYIMGNIRPMLELYLVLGKQFEPGQLNSAILNGCSQLISQQLILAGKTIVQLGVNMHACRPPIFHLLHQTKGEMRSQSSAPGRCPQGLGTTSRKFQQHDPDPTISFPLPGEESMCNWLASRNFRGSQSCHLLECADLLLAIIVAIRDQDMKNLRLGLQTQL